MKTATRPRRSVSVTTEVDVDVCEDELREKGWHHEDDCDVLAESAAYLEEESRTDPLGPAVASLHRQAHPGQPRSITLCREEPCRSLTLDQLKEVGNA
jgi:hypothetical protein